MRLLRRLNPLPGVRDFWDEFRRPQPYRLPILLVSIAVPALLIVLVISSSTVPKQPEKPEITWISTFAPNRTDAEIAQSNIENQRRKDIVAAELARREEERRDMYRSLGRMSGMDVDSIDRDVAREQAEERAEHDAYMKRMLGEQGDDAQR